MACRLLKKARTTRSAPWFDYKGRRTRDFVSQNPALTLFIRFLASVSAHREWRHIFMAMEKFVIEGGHELSGTVTVGGSKNEALPVIAATLLSTEPVVLRRVPRSEEHTSELQSRGH